MVNEPTGSKPDGQQVQQPGVMPTQEPTGIKKDESVMPTDTEVPIIEEDTSVEKDGEKVVPFASYEAEKKKRQEFESKLEEVLGQQTSPTPIEEPVLGEKAPDINWDALLGLTSPPPSTPESTPVTPPQPSQPQGFSIQEFNESLREQRESGDELGALYRAGMFFQAQQDAMRDAAKRVVKDYDNLPLNTVSNKELQFFQQNPEALRAVLAKNKGNKTATPALSVAGSPGSGNSQGSNWEELQEKLRQEGRQEVIQKLSGQSGTSGEGARSSTTPTGEVLELDSDGKEYLRKRKIPEDQWPKYAKALQDELAGRF